MKRILYTCLLGFTLASFSWESHYQVEDIKLPEGVDPQIGGLDLNKDGEIVACFHRGQVMIYNQENDQWREFGKGLHEPLGILAEDDGSILVVQRPEITRLKDTNGDGVADLYETVCDDWGMSGNYHEFNFGLVKDSKGNLYISLGTASSGAGVREEVRGEWNTAGGLTHELFLTDPSQGSWSDQKKTKDIPRMYARVPYRGCVLKVSPGNRKAEVYATGLRTPNGLYMDENDQLWITDNQGDWVGASKLHRIQEGKFHGHVASLLWDPENPVTDEVPLNLPVEELDALRVKAAALLPQGEAGNSLTQSLPGRTEFFPIDDASSIIVGEMNEARLVHYFKDEVNGVHQGAATHTLNTTSIGAGNNRLLFSPDGKTLYLGKTHLSWPGREGLKKITYKDKPYLMAQAVKMTSKGFDITYNAPINFSADKSTLLVESFGLIYSKQYGSPKEDLETLEISQVKTSGKTLSIELAKPLAPNKIYDINIPAELTSELGGASSSRFWYTAHEVVK